MKVGINATFLTRNPTGLGVFTRETTRHISGLERDFIVFSPVAVKGVSEDFLYKVPSSIGGSLNLRNNLMRFLYLNTRLPLLCRSRKVDVLFCPMMEFPFMPLVPLVVQVHDLHPVKFASQFGLSSVHFRISLNLLEKSARRVTVSSEFVKKELLDAVRIKEEMIDVVPLAYDKDRFYPGDREQKGAFMAKYSLKRPYILTVGNLFPYKNIDSLVDAFLKIKGSIAHSLVVVGRKDLAGRRLRDDERVLYTDYVSDEDLPKFYSYADLAVHPSLSEGFGIAPLEAMACGTPVICSDRASLPEVVADAGLLFDPADETALGELILKVLGNEGLRRELSAKGLKRARLFSWEKTASGILDSCRKALKENR